MALSAIIRRIFTLACASVLLLSLAACGGDGSASDRDAGQTAPEDLRYGGEITLAYGGCASLDPAYDAGCSYLLMYEPLFTINWAYDREQFDFSGGALTYEYISGQLAKSWEWDEDKGVVTVELRGGVSFQDKAPFNGRSLTAGDVKYSYDRLLGFDGALVPEAATDWAGELYMLSDISVKGNNKVCFTFDEDYRSDLALNDFLTVFVRITGREWDELGFEEKSSAQYACGTGPYVLSELTQDGKMIFTRNDGYYGYDERYPGNKLPYIDKVTLLLVDDAQAAAELFISGKLDWTGTALDGAALSGIDESELPGGSLYAYSGAAAPGIGLHADKAPFDDINVRIAVQRCIDTDAINEYLGNDGASGFAGLWGGRLSMLSAEAVDEKIIEEYSCDLSAAKELLAQSDYPDGFEFTVLINRDDDEGLYSLAAGQLAKAGVTMHITRISDPFAQALIITDPSDSRQFSIVSGGYASLDDIAANIVPGGYRFGLFYSDDDFLQAWTRLRSAESLSELKSAGQRLDEIYLSSHWVIQLGSPAYSVGYMSARVGGYAGERIDEGYYMNTVAARIWLREG